MSGIWPANGSNSNGLNQRSQTDFEADVPMC